MGIKDTEGNFGRERVLPERPSTLVGIYIAGYRPRETRELSLQRACLKVCQLKYQVSMDRSNS